MSSQRYQDYLKADSADTIESELDVLSTHPNPDVR